MTAGASPPEADGEALPFLTGWEQTERCDMTPVVRAIALFFVLLFSPAVAATGGESAAPRPGDALVAGTGFHATGNIPCAREAGQPMAPCRFGVTRGPGQGAGEVTVFWPDGGQRMISFEDATPVRYNESQADGDARMSVGRQDDTFHIRIGTQRFAIPMAVITGG